MTSEEADERIRLAVRRLHEWRWMVTLSKEPEVVLENLRSEAKALINIGLEHPRKTADISKVVVAYNRFIVSMKKVIDKRAARQA